MGSRISRAYFSNERRIPVQRRGQLKQAVSSFVGFLLVLLMFFLGFMTPIHCSPVIGLLILCVSVAVSIRQLTWMFLSCVFLLLTSIVSAITSSSLDTLVSVGILQILGFATMVTQSVTTHSHIKSLLLWAQLQLFYAGQLLRQQTSNGKQPNHLIRIVFSIISLFIVTLAIMGLPTYKTTLYKVNLSSISYVLVTILSLCPNTGTLNWNIFLISAVSVSALVSLQLKKQYLLKWEVTLLLLLEIIINIFFDQQLLALKLAALNIIWIDSVGQWIASSECRDFLNAVNAKIIVVPVLSIFLISKEIKNYDSINGMKQIPYSNILFEIGLLALYLGCRPKKIDLQ